MCRHRRSRTEPGSKNFVAAICIRAWEGSTDFGGAIIMRQPWILTVYVHEYVRVCGWETWIFTTRDIPKSTSHISRVFIVNAQLCLSGWLLLFTPRSLLASSHLLSHSRGFAHTFQFLLLAFFKLFANQKIFFPCSCNLFRINSFLWNLRLQIF